MDGAAFALRAAFALAFLLFGSGTSAGSTSAGSARVVDRVRTRFGAEGPGSSGASVLAISSFFRLSAEGCWVPMKAQLDGTDLLK